MAHQSDEPQREAAAPAQHPGTFISDPAPLGLAGFASTTLVLSLVNAEAIPAAVLSSAVVALAFFYGGLAQLLAGMWEFKKGNTFGSTAFGTYGAFWIALASYVAFFSSGLSDAEDAQALGWFLVMFTIVTFYLFIASLRLNVALMLVFLTLVVTYVLLDIGELAGIGAAGIAGGWVGVACACLAFYASAAFVVNFTFKRTVFPVIPLSKA
jgi:succinate-acetate transporter protein